MKKINIKKCIAFDPNDQRDTFTQALTWEALSGPIEQMRSQAKKVQKYLNPKKTKKISLLRYILSRATKILGIILAIGFGMLVLYVIKDILLYIITYAAIATAIILIIYGLLVLIGCGINKKLV